MTMEFRDLVKSFGEDLSRGAVDIDKYFRETENAVRKASLSHLVSGLNEVFKQRLGALPNIELNALHLVLLAGALFRAACESEEPDRNFAVLLGYSYATLARGKPQDVAVFLLASIATAHGRGDVATELLKKIGIELEHVVNFACGAVELAKFFETADPAALDW